MDKDHWLQWSLCLCSVTSLVPCLGISLCWGLPWSMEISIYYQYLYLLALWLGRVLLQNLIWFDLIEGLQEADGTGQCGSGRGVTALLELGVTCWQQAGSAAQPREQDLLTWCNLEFPGVPPKLSGPLGWKLSRGGTIQIWMLWLLAEHYKLNDFNLPFT